MGNSLCAGNCCCEERENRSCNEVQMYVLVVILILEVYETVLHSDVIQEVEKLFLPIFIVLWR